MGEWVRGSWAEIQKASESSSFWIIREKPFPMIAVQVGCRGVDRYLPTYLPR